MVYLVPFSAQEAPSQGCGQTAGSESRSALTGGRADVHDPLRGLVVPRSQPCEGSPHTNPLAQRAMSACPLRSAAASLRKGIARRQPCEGSPHTNPLARRAMSACPLRSGADSLRKGIARSPSEGSPHTNPLAQRAMSARPMRSVSQPSQGDRKAQPCEGSPHTNPLARRAMSACPLRSVGRQPSQGGSQRPTFRRLAAYESWRSGRCRPVRCARCSQPSRDRKAQPAKLAAYESTGAAAMSACPMRSAAASLRKGIARTLNLAKARRIRIHWRSGRCRLVQCAPLQPAFARGSQGANLASAAHAPRRGLGARAVVPNVAWFLTIEITKMLPMCA